MVEWKEKEQSNLDIDFVMREYFSMKKENERLVQRHREMEQAVKVAEANCAEAIERLSAMKKKRPKAPANTAEWIDNSPSIFHRCSHCGCGGYRHFEYCPFCGSKMTNYVETGEY